MLKNSPGLSSYRGFGVPSSRTISRGTFYRGENPADYSKTMLKERGDPLAEFSGIHPEKIIGKQKPTKEQALRFVSGGSPIGNSIVSGAKNKIVGFDRNIKPKPNNLKSLISNLASNIFNTSSVNNIFNTTKKEKTPEKKEKGFKPFGGFFDKFKEALAFITFFGSKKNLDRIRENVDNLKTTFAETFEVAKSLRKVILKIIEQISGLSGGGGGGGLLGAIMSALGGLVGGLVPGLGGKRPPNIAGPAIKQKGNLISKMPKALTSGGGGISKLLLGGAAALGTGAAISGLSQPDNSENIQPGYTTPEVPGNVLDKFNSILDRFDKVIESLLKGKGSGSQKPSGSSGGSKSSGSTSAGSPSSSNAGPSVPSPGSDTLGNVKGGKIQGISDEDYKYLGMVAGGEAGPGDDPYAVAASVLNRMASGKGNSVKDVIMSPGQYAAVTGSGARPGFSPKLEAMFKSPEGQAKMVAALEKLQGRTDFKGQEILKNRVASQDPMVDTKGNYYHYSWQTSKNSVSPSGWTQPNWQKYIAQVNTTSSVPKGGIVTVPKPASGQAPQTPTPKPAPGQAPQAPTPKPTPGQQSIQVVPVQQQSQVQPAPSGGGGKISTPPSPKQNGPTAPFLPSSNPNNFLTLYSRMVYNIVDG